MRPSHPHLLWGLGFIVQALALLAPYAMAATTAYKNTTGELDLTRVRLSIAAPANLAEPFHDRVVKLFADHGLVLDAANAPPSSALATLTLTLNPQPLEACPGRLLYAPSLTLTEPVTIPRTERVYPDTTWLFESGKHVLKQVDAMRMEQDLDDLVGQFLADYRSANARQQHGKGYVSRTGKTAVAHEAVRQAPVLNVTVLAGSSSPALRTLAEHQLKEAGFSVAPASQQQGAVDLSIELVQSPLGEDCDGQVMYERGIYLVEPVRVTRSPQVILWADTWRDESVRIVPPLSAQDLESDLLTLVQGFITSWAGR